MTDKTSPTVAETMKTSRATNRDDPDDRAIRMANAVRQANVAAGDPDGKKAQARLRRQTG